MMYLWVCERCRVRMVVHAKISNRDVPNLCPECSNAMLRIFGTFHFTACLERDKAENQLYRMLTKSSSPKDWEAAEASDAERYAKKTAGMDTKEAPYVSMDELDISGAWTAAHAGPDQLARWRSDNIKTEELPECRPVVTEEVV